MTNDTASEPLYRNPSWLRQKYAEEGLSDSEIAECCEASRRTICDWREKFEIAGRDAGEAYQLAYSRKPVPLHQKTGGYEVWIDGSCRVETGIERARVHRLAAVAWFGFDAVRDMDVHHKNNVPWDNRRENLELISRSDHTKHHYLSGESGIDGAP